MCLVSTPSAPAPVDTTPVYMHNPWLDNPGSGNPQFTGSQNELGAGFNHASANANALAGNTPQPTNSGQGLQTPTAPQTGPGGRTPGLVLPSFPGNGGVFAGVPAAGVRPATR